MADLKICPIRQVVIEDGLFLEWYAFDRCLISLSLLPINDLDGSDHIENIMPVSSFWSRTEFRLSIKIIKNFLLRYLCVRPGTVGLLIGAKYSRVGNSTWICPTSIVSTRIGVELVGVHEN